MRLQIVSGKRFTFTPRILASGPSEPHNSMKLKSKMATSWIAAPLMLSFAAMAQAVQQPARSAPVQDPVPAARGTEITSVALVFFALTG
jgi:hypothetical protein